MSDDAEIRLLERRAADGQEEALEALDTALVRSGRRRLPDFGSDLDEVLKYADFKAGQVAETLASEPGWNDGDSWWAVVRLFDGRIGYVEAHCDYTGWG